MKNTTVKHNGPGRPMYNPVIPRGKFTIAEFCEANGVNPKTGKGKACSKLTLIKFLGRKQGKALIVRVKGETANPNSKKGLGRKAFLYTRRAGVTVPKATAAPVKQTRTRKATAPTATSDYEATKSALLAPTPAVVITPDPTPAPETAPVVDVAPVSEPVAETVATPAPEPVTA